MLAQEKKMMLLSKNIFFVLPIAAVRQESGGVLDCVVEHHFTNAPLPLGTGCHVVNGPSRAALFAPGRQVLQHFGALQQCIPDTSNIEKEGKCGSY